MTLIEPRTLLWLRAFELYKAGHLPNAGGWLSQPAKLLDVFSVIEAEVARMTGEQADR